MIDINIKGVLYGIAAALPVFRKQGFGHFVNTDSTAGIIVNPNMAVYAGTKFAVRAISRGLREEAGDKLCMTIISPGFVRTDFTESMTSPEMKARIRDRMDKMAILADAIARAIVLANRATRRCWHLVHQSVPLPPLSGVARITACRKKDKRLQSGRPGQ
jgi:NADP-dependent 3-hydroxy acid dehydrogenase YdfG